MRYFYHLTFCFIFILSINISIMAEPDILMTEIMADNDVTLLDEDGEASDWIELFNAGSDKIDLEGWSLTDDSNDLQQWTFPSVSLGAREYLVVFASSKNRINPEGELHTNFNLNADGEYLALVEPDGQTIHFEYNPYYPPLREDVSYGLPYKHFQFAGRDSMTRYQVPMDDSLGDEWTTIDFNDQSWNSATLGIGYGSKPGSFAVTVYRSRVNVSNLSTSEQVINNTSYQLDQTTVRDDVINYADERGGGNYDPNEPFPGQTSSSAFDDFVVLATASITISQESTWTFGINSDDGARLRVDGKTVINDDNTHSPQDTFGTVELDAGDHVLELTYFERGGGAEVELFAANGEYSSFNAAAFHLIGDRKLEGLALGGFGSMIQSSVESVMKGNNATIYTRVPFTVEDASILSSLQLDVFYNDGFIAYLNGKEIARRNAPTNASWNSSASQSRGDEVTLVPETFEITLKEGALLNGKNILAFHGLNASASDEDFLLHPKLTATALIEKKKYFVTPTPGEENNVGYNGFVGDIFVSQERGFYNEPIDVQLFSQTPNAEIRYTIDGSEPRADHGQVYDGPFTIDQTTPLRAAGFLPGFHPSKINTQTYIFIDDVLEQTRPASYPTVWGNGVSADYAMDPEVVNDPEYQDQMHDAMTSIPTLSLVTDRDNLFDSSTGIYTNTTNKGGEWERPASAELIHPSGIQGFQIDHGLRIQGGYSRLPDRRKHSFRLLFKRDYGPPKLRYPIFDHSTVDEFDTLVLRGYYNYSWHAQEGGFGSNIGKADYIRDEFSRRTQLALGQYASHGTYVHLYLNGMYWGIYNICERPDDSFSAEHIGGEKEEWDCITSGTRGVDHTQVKAGNKEAWNTMMTMANQGGFSDPEKYQAIQNYVHVPALIDYMLTIYYTGNRDAPTVIGGSGKPWNFYSSYWREGYSPFRFYCWDSEWTLEEPTRNVVTFHNGRENPAMILHKLKANPEFSMLLADHIQKHFFHDGALTPEKSIVRYRELKEMIDLAIIAESARWGDTKGGNLKTRNDNWLPEVNRIMNEYLPRRTEIVVNQLRRSRLFPQIDAPVFNQHGGEIEPGFQLTMSSQGMETTTQEWIDIEASWRYNQTGSDLGTAWKEADYDDSAWDKGQALLFVENSSLPASKNTQLTLGETTYYFRTTFDVPTSIKLENVSLEMRTVIDDGAVIYINGEEVRRMRLPDGNIDHSDFANQTVSNATYEGPFSISSEVLRAGENVIAVEVHQTNATSSDIVFGLELNAVVPTDTESLPIFYTLDGSDPRAVGGDISDRALRYEDSISLLNTTQVKARTLSGDTWSALNQATFFIDPTQTDLAKLQNHLLITEVMYNPKDGNEYEFIELYNSHENESLPLAGIGFTNGIQYSFPASASIAPQSYILVGRAEDMNMVSLREYYNLEANVPIYGPYGGRISNEGERVTLSHVPSSTELISFEYNDGRGWPVAADGAGHSMIPLLSTYQTQSHSALEYGGNWCASYAIHGSPAEEDSLIVPSMMINEFAANTIYQDANNPNYSSNDWIELYNASESDIHLGGWYLSDDEDDLKKWEIPAMDVPAHGFISFDEVTGFHRPIPSGFGLSRDGEELFLSYLPGVHGVDRVVDAVTFKAQKEGFTLGRFGDGAKWWETLRPSRNLGNKERVAHVVIDELMYQPLDESEAYTGSEYIELFNPLFEDVMLENEQGSWRIGGGIDFVFPENTTIPARGYLLLVGFDPSNTTQRDVFLQLYNLDESTVMYGPYDGKLSNTGERIALEKPLITNDPLARNWVIVDEVIYFHTQPWPEVNREGLHSLTRRFDDESGNEPTNWVSAKASPGEKANIDTHVEAWSLY